VQAVNTGTGLGMSPPLATIAPSAFLRLGASRDSFLTRFVMEAAGRSASGLACTAGVSSSTLTRFPYQVVMHLLAASALSER
jgi:hypothetical protein